MKDNKDRVVLEMTREQAWTVERACEIFARMLLGQFEMIPDLLDLPIGSNLNEYCKRRDNAKEAMSLAAKLLYGRTAWNMPDVNGKSEQHERAWSLYTVLRYTRSWDENPEGNKWSVCYDEPTCPLNEPIAKCKIVKE